MVIDIAKLIFFANGWIALVIVAIFSLKAVITAIDIFTKDS